MNRPDFEINAILRARKLTTLVVPDSEMQVEGEVKLERREVRTGQPLHARKTEEGVAVDKQVTGRLSKER